jgi:hypothetical protein
MGPFSYFPKMSTEDARAVHVLNRELMENLLESAPCRVAACSDYAFAISAPQCSETPREEQMGLFRRLKRHYEWGYPPVRNFGQNATTLLLLKRKGEALEVAK